MTTPTPIKSKFTRNVKEGDVIDVLPDSIESVWIKVTKVQPRGPIIRLTGIEVDGIDTYQRAFDPDVAVAFRD